MVEAIKSRNPDEAERAARELINFTERHVTEAVKTASLSSLRSSPGDAGPRWRAIELRRTGTEVRPAADSRPTSVHPGRQRTFQHRFFRRS
jgi:hypothetical protein